MDSKKSNNADAFKAGIWYTVVNFIAKGATFLTTPIFTRIMSASDIGTYSNISSWHHVLIYIFTFDLCTSLSLARFDYRDELAKYSSSVLVYGTTITAFFYLIAILNAEAFCDFLSIPQYAMHAIFINMLVNPALQMYQALSRFKYKYKTSAFLTLSSLVLSVGISLILVLTMNDQLLGRVIGMFISVSVFYLVLYVHLLYKGKGVSLKYLKYSLSISFPMIWHSVATHLLGAGDRIVITKFLGAEKNALYSVAYTSSVIASVLWSAMNTAWSPWSTECMDRGETEQMRKASKPYVLFFAFVVLVMLLITPEILLAMGGRKYVDAKFVLPPVIVGCLCQFIYSLYVNAEFYLKKQTRIAFATMFAAALNIGLNIFFVPRYGYVAAAYTTLFGYIVLFAFHFISLITLGRKDWYDNKFNIMIIGFFLILVPFSNWLYQHNVIRYVCIIFVAIVSLVLAWIKKTWIKSFLADKIGIRR